MTEINKESVCATAISVTSDPQLLGDGSDNEEDGLPVEPPGAPALPVDENGNTVYRYRDFGHVDENDAELDGDIPTATPNNRGNSESSIRVQKFPVKLYAILAQKEFHDIICWMPHGRSWKVLKPSMFESLVMPLFFEYSNYHSFNRLVNAWSFRRISSGPDRGSYYHELFLRGKPHLQNYMRRLPKTHKKLPMKKKDEPNFYKLNQTHPLPALHEAPIPGGAAVQVMCNRMPQTGSLQTDASSNLSPMAPQQQSMMIVTPNVSPQYSGPGIMGGSNGFMGGMGPGNMGMGGMNHTLGMNGRSAMGIGIGQGGMAGGMGGAQGRFGGFNEIENFKDEYDHLPMQSYAGLGVGSSIADQPVNFINPMMGGNGGYISNNGYSSSSLGMKNGAGLGNVNSLDLNGQWQSDYYQGYSQQAMMPNMQGMQQQDLYGRSLAFADDYSTASSGVGVIGRPRGKLLGGTRNVV